MNPRAKFVLTLLAFTVLLTGVLSGLYLKRTSDDLTEQFRERAVWRAQVFADLASRRLASDDWRELLSTIFIAPDVLYAQVVHEGQVRAVRERIPAPPVELQSSEDRASQSPQSREYLVAKVRESQTAQAQAYFDITYPLGESTDFSSYVRLGLARAPLDQELQSEILMMTLIALVALALAGLAIGFLAKLFFPSAPPALMRQPLHQEMPVSANTAFEPPAEEAESLTASSGATVVEAETVASAKVNNGLFMDHAGKRVLLNGTEVKLSPKEYDLLKLLASEPGRVFSNEEILAAVWAGRQWATAQDVKQYVYFVRKKLEEDPENPQFIITVRGFGYKLNAKF